MIIRVSASFFADPTLLRTCEPGCFVFGELVYRDSRYCSAGGPSLPLLLTRAFGFAESRTNWLLLQKY